MRRTLGLGFFSGGSWEEKTGEAGSGGSCLSGFERPVWVGPLGEVRRPRSSAPEKLRPPARSWRGCRYCLLLDQKATGSQGWSRRERPVARGERPRRHPSPTLLWREVDPCLFLGLAGAGMYSRLRARVGGGVGLEWGRGGK